MTKTQALDGTGYSYIRGDKNVIFSNGVMLPNEVFDVLKNSGDVVKEILKRKSAGEQRYDFNAAVNDRKLIPITEQPSAKEEVKPVVEAKIEKKEVEKPKELIQEPVITVPIHTKKSSVVTIVSTMMYIVAAGGAAMSAYHGALFLIQSGKSIAIAWIISSILICFSAVSFTAARFFFEEKGMTKIFGLLFVVLALGIISYSIFSTIAVNYDQFTKAEKEDSSLLIESSSVAESAQRRKDMLRIEVERLDEEIRTRDEDIKKLRDQIASLRDNYYFTRANEAVIDLNILEATQAFTRQQRTNMWNEFMSADTVIAEAEQTVLSERPAIYDFTARLFSVDADALRFIIYTIPACVFDILAPLGLSVVLLLRSKRERDFIS